MRRQTRTGMGLDRKVLVEYEEDGIQAWITSKRIRGGQICVGASIEARYNDGRWYRAEVIQVKASQPMQLPQSITSNRLTSTSVDDKTMPTHTLLTSLKETQTKSTQKPAHLADDEQMKPVDSSASSTIPKKTIALDTDSKTALHPVDHVLRAASSPTSTSANFQEPLPTVLPSSQLLDKESNCPDRHDSIRQTSTEVDDKTIPTHTLLFSLKETQSKSTQKPAHLADDEQMKPVDSSASSTIPKKTIALETDLKTALHPVHHVLRAASSPTSANFHEPLPTVLSSSQLLDEASNSPDRNDSIRRTSKEVDFVSIPAPLSSLDEIQTKSLLELPQTATPQLTLSGASKTSSSAHWAESFDHSKTPMTGSHFVVELPALIEISIPGVSDWRKSAPFAPFVRSTMDGYDGRDESSTTHANNDASFMNLHPFKQPTFQLPNIANEQELMGHSSYVVSNSIPTEPQISSRTIINNTESCSGTLQQNWSKTCKFHERAPGLLQLKSSNYETPATTDFANDELNGHHFSMQQLNVNNSELYSELYVPQSSTEVFDVATNENQLTSNELFNNPKPQQSCITQATASSQPLFGEDYHLYPRDSINLNNNYLLANENFQPNNPAHITALGGKMTRKDAGTEITNDLTEQTITTLQPHYNLQSAGTSSSLYDTGVLLRQTERVLTEEYPMANLENEISQGVSIHENLNDVPPAHSTEDSSVSEDGTDDDEKPDTDIHVIQTNNKLGRKYDRVDNCYYCNKAKTNIDRHLTTVHQNEYLILQAIAGCKEVLERRLSLLRNLGNHKANLDARKRNAGPFFVVYRPNTCTDYRQYLPCCNCYGYYMSRQLYRHKCRAGDREISLREGRLLLMSCETQISPKLAVILSQLRSDHISLIIRNDPLILRFGESLTKKHGHDHHQNGYIRNRMRQLARLLDNLRKVEKAAQLKDFIHPSKFQAVLQAVRTTAELNPEKELYGIPSLAFKLGHSLKKCAVLVKGEGLETGDMSKVKESESFLELCSNFWSEEVSSQALRELSDLNMNKNDLPVPSDVIKIHDYLKKQLEINLAKLSSGTTLEKLAAIRSTAELLLSQLTIFNFRRQGETSKLTVKNFKSASKISNTVALDSLSLAERQMSTRMRRVEIKGKKGKIVPILFTDDMTTSLEKMIEARTQLCPELNNELLFSSSQATSKNPNSHLRACDAIRKHAVACGAENPQNLTSTSMRKHVATAMQVMNLSDNEMDVIAKFMGHDIRIHRKNYRLPDQALQLGKVTRVLLALEVGKVKDLSGQNLINFKESSPGETVAAVDVVAATSELTVGADTTRCEVNLHTTGTMTSSSVLSHHWPSGSSLPTDDEWLPEVTGGCHDDRRESEDGSTLQNRGVKRKASQRNPWNESEKKFIHDNLAYFIVNRILPGKEDILEGLGEENDIFQTRNWRNIKDFIRNTYLKKKH